MRSSYIVAGGITIALAGHTDTVITAGFVDFERRGERATEVLRGQHGALRTVGGDASVLLRTHAAIGALPDLFAAMRPDTEW